MDTIERLARAALNDIAPYVPGKPIEELQRERGLAEIVKLASNENPLGPSPRAVAAAREALAGIHRYPDSSAFRLTRAVAETAGADPSGVIFGAGSCEVIAHLMLAFLDPGDEIVVPAPSFVIYTILARMVGAVPVPVPLREDFTYDLDAMLARIGPRTKIVVLCTPNNPTGTLIPPDGLERFFSRAPDDVVILCDEAYREYADDPDAASAFPWIGRKNVLITRTFAKIHGLASLRIGYGIGRPAIVAKMEKCRMPFNTSGPAQAAALAALGDADHVRASRENNRREKARLEAACDRLGIRRHPTQGNFILWEFRADASALVAGLEGQGVIVRPLRAFGLPGNFVRVTIGTPAENDVLISKVAPLIP